jgi:hypothetical protein
MQHLNLKCLQKDDDLAAWLTELKGVTQEVDNYLDESTFVAVD